MNNIILLLIAELTLAIFITITTIIMIKTYRSLLLEERISKFSLNNKEEIDSFIFKAIKDIYNKFIKKIANNLKKLYICKILSKTYNKYVNHTGIEITSEELLANKIILGILGIIIAIITDILKYSHIDINSLLVGFIILFFIPDLFLFISYKKTKKKLENDLYKAVIIMSNAFKAGRSIMQAIDIVSKELEGPIGSEFKRMYIDLNYGLSLEVVFERLNKRINLEETKYMASSLIVLNKTGGNVMKVFSSIEKSFTERKKLNDELKSVTALSKFVFKILVIIPFIIFISIYVLNPSYFNPFFTTITGNILLGLIIIIYLLYIFIVKKVIKIRE